MAFEGIFGKTGIAAFGVLGLFVLVVEASETPEGVLIGVWAWDTILLTPSGAALGNGGGNGDMEMVETDAVWAL